MPRAKSILIDEIHLTVHVPRKLPEVDCQAIRAVLLGSRFWSHLNRAVRQVGRRYPALVNASIQLSR
jgi:hypothetical protein